ncbi:MAG: N-acetyltransferase family protein [Streptosporangiaceae bacterium]
MNQTPVEPAGLLRAARDSDADRIREFVCGLSPRSQYFRFFATVAPPSSGLLRALAGANGTADVLLVTDRLGTIVAHGMAVDDGAATDIGVVVADGWQQRGMGTLLLDALVDRAAGRGIRTLVLDVLPANERMLAMIARRWPAAPRERTPDAIVIRPQLPGPVTSPHVLVPSVVSLDRHFHTGDHGAANRPAA